MRLTFVQYGDYREAVQNFEAGVGEQYYSQRYCVDYVADLAKSVDNLSVICLNADPYDEYLPNGIHVIGTKMWRVAGPKDMVRLVAAEEPTHLVLRTPLIPLLGWALRENVRTLPLFADSFSHSTLIRRIHHFRLARLLNNPKIQWVGNHNVNSALDLKKIGVGTNKIIPWDYPSPVHPSALPAKTLSNHDGKLRIIYVGQTNIAKGLGDTIEAAARLQHNGRDVEMTILGRGKDREALESLAREQGMAGRVHFMGKVPHNRVIELMHENDVVVVPSRHEYPEGMPLTIYDSFCSRTPLVASDHPMFKGRVVDGESGLVFPAKNPEALAEKIERLMSDPELYTRLSEFTVQAWERLQCPVVWGEFISAWLRDSEEDRGWLAQHTLAAGDYIIPRAA